MDNYKDETERLVNDANEASISPISATIRPNPQPIPANRLALDAQIQAAAEYQRRLRQRRRIYYIILITGVTMLIFSILSFVAWILHGSSQQIVQAKNMVVEISTNEVNSATEDISTLRQSTLNARKHPTRTINHENMKQLLKRSELESDEDKDETQKKSEKKSRPPTRTRKLSFAPEKIVDYKPNFRPI